MKTNLSFLFVSFTIAFASFLVLPDATAAQETDTKKERADTSRFDADSVKQDADEEAKAKRAERQKARAAANAKKKKANENKAAAKKKAGENKKVATKKDGATPPNPSPAKDTKPEKYQFTIERSVDCTSVKSQGSTGTCWCFATSSFLESELMRRGKGEFDLSEMFIVKNVYKDKAQNFVLRQGKANFSQGALAHDFINAVERHGLMLEDYFSGLDDGASRHSHGEMEALLKGMLEAVIKQSKPSEKWSVAFENVLDVYLGQAPETFGVEGKSMTPKEFANSVDFRGDDYINITSYTHHPFYKSFVLEIPDNFSNGSFYNLPIEDLLEVVHHAVENGYSVAWDGDVSESGFSAGKGIAVLPAKSRPDALTIPGEEAEVTQEMRQKTLYSYNTTDDHLMHLTGIATDQNGTKYFVIKNSWGKVGPEDGFLYMSETYARLKTVSILVHKDALPEHLQR